MPRLASTVYVQDERGNAVAFGPGDAVPSWAAAQIANPKAWADAPIPAHAVPVDDQAVGPVGAAVTVPDDTVPDDPSQPPMGGPGSSRDAWAVYATSIGVDVQQGTSKADIVAEVDRVRAAG